MNKIVGFLGVGNMGGAILRGALNKKVLEPSNIWTYDKINEKVEVLHKEYCVNIAKDLAQLVNESCVLFLCVKPQDAKGVLKAMANFDLKGKLLISIMAGVSIDVILGLLGQKVSVARAMPNTPLLVGEGMTAVCYKGDSMEEHMRLVRSVFESVGRVVEVREDLMDPITALSGSGPGFVFKLMEVFVEEATRYGIHETVAVEMVCQTFLGAAKLAMVSSKGLTELREMVTSKGGTTEAGLRAFSELALEDGLREVLRRATLRAKALNREVGSQLSQ